MDKIDNIYVINLDQSKDRLNNITNNINKQLKKNFTRIPAIYGKDLTNEELNKYTNIFCRYLCTPAMIGCGLSHIKTWKKCIENDDKYSMIIEDDCEFTDDFLQEFEKVIDELDKTDSNWDFLYLGCLGDCSDVESSLNEMIFSSLLTKIKASSKQLNTTHIFIPSRPVGFHCYVISNSCAKKLISLFNDKITYHVDVSFLDKSDNFSIYASKKRIAYQLASHDQSFNSGSFPNTLNKILSVKDKNSISYSYHFTVPMFQLFGFPINWHLILLLIATWVIPNKYVSLYFSLFLVLMIVELFIDPKHLYFITVWIVLVSLILYKNHKQTFLNFKFNLS